MKFKLIPVALLLAGLIGSTGAFAADTNSLTVTANIVGTCKFSTATSTLAFGALDVTATTDATASGSVSYWCTKGTTATVSAGAGLFDASGSKRMQNTTTSTEYIPYSMTLNGAATATGSGAGKSNPLTVALAGTITNANYINAAAGSYTDTVVLSVSP